MVETKLYKADKSWHPHYRGQIINSANNQQVPRNGRITFCAVVKCVFGPRHTFMTLLKVLTLIALCVTCFFNLKLIFETKNRLEQEQMLLESDYIYKSHHLEEEYYDARLDGRNENNQILNLKVVSSKDLVKVVINNDTIHAAVSDDDRGIHLIVVNQHSGHAMSTKVFDTFVEHQDEAMIKFIDSISNQQRILIFAVKDEASFNLKEFSRDKLKSLGSKMIESLQWRGMWLMICTKSGILFDERISHSDDTASWAKPLSSQLTISTKDLDQDSCTAWVPNEESRKRKSFCSKYEGYGNLCTCENPQTLSIKSAKLENNLMFNIPITVIASNRPQYLYRMLISLLSAHGVNKDMIIVFIDGNFQETADVCGLFNIKSIIHDPIGVKNARISQHYKASLAATFNIHSKAQFALILEDDLQVSTDITSYFSQTLPLLEHDPSLYCISAWNDQGYEHAIHDPSLLYRVDTMPGLGWILKRSIFKELEPKWPTPEKQWDWDMWMRHETNRQGRECVIPDVSRTFHFGESGVNMNPHFYRMYFENHALNQEEDVALKNVDQLQENEYERLMHSLIRDGVLLDHDKTPCDDNFVDDDTIHDDDKRTFIAYFSMEDDGSTSTFKSILKCLNLFDLEPRGLHKSAFRTFIKGHHVIFVGYPASPYSVYKHIDIEPISIKTTSET